MALYSHTGWDKYQEARTKVDDFLKKGSSGLKDSLELLALERTKINKQLIKEWILEIQEHIPNVHSYVNFADISDKLGRAYSRYWHYVFLYRALYENKDNILPIKVYSFELYFLTMEKVLEKNYSSQIGAVDHNEENQSLRLFYSFPLGHFLLYKFTKEYVISLAPKPEVAALILTGDVYSSFTRVRDLTVSKFVDFFSSFDPEQCRPDSFRTFIESDLTLSGVFQIIDEGSPKHEV